MNKMKLELGQKVYHQRIYSGKEEMKIVGIREDEVELEGDYSGGTNYTIEKDWLHIEGLIFIKNEDIINKLKPIFNDDNFIGDVCLSYLHDFGLLTDDEKNKLIFECKEWFRSILNNLYYKI